MRVAGGSEKREAWGSKIKVTSSILDPFIPKDPKIVAAKSTLDSEGNHQVDLNVRATLEVPTARPQSVPCHLESSFSTKMKLPLIGIEVPGWKLPRVKATFKDGTEVDFVNFAMPMVSSDLQKRVFLAYLVRLFSNTSFLIWYIHGTLCSSNLSFTAFAALPLDHSNS